MARHAPHRDACASGVCGVRGAERARVRFRTGPGGSAFQKRETKRLIMCQIGRVFCRFGGKAACGSGQTYPEKEQKRVTEQDEGTDGKNSQGQSPRRGAQCDQTGQYFISPERGRRPHSKHADAVYCIPFPRNHLRGHFAEGSLQCVEHVLFITTLSKSDKTSAADTANQLTQEFR